MKFSKKRNQYEASNVSFNPDTIEAFSYGWWKFVTVIDGKVIFNNYNYSPSTCKHQSKVRVLMEKLGIKIDMIVNTRANLRSHVWQEENAQEIDREIKKLEQAIATPRSHKAKNEERRAEIERLEQHKVEMLSLGKTRLECVMAAI